MDLSIIGSQLYVVDELVTGDIDNADERFRIKRGDRYGDYYVASIHTSGVGSEQNAVEMARLFAAAPRRYREMLRYLPVLDRAEADPEIWARLTEGLGIATLNGYLAAVLDTKVHVEDRK